MLCPSEACRAQHWVSSSGVSTASQRDTIRDQPQQWQQAITKSHHFTFLGYKQASLQPSHLVLSLSTHLGMITIVSSRVFVNSFENSGTSPTVTEPSKIKCLCFLCMWLHRNSVRCSPTKKPTLCNEDKPDHTGTVMVPSTPPPSKLSLVHLIKTDWPGRKLSQPLWKQSSQAFSCFDFLMDDSSFWSLLNCVISYPIC